MRSSYIEADYGRLIEEYVKAWQPATFVELGVLDGYSTMHIARGLQWLHKLRGWKPKLDAYDLFEEYPYKHGTKHVVQDELDTEGLSEYVNLQYGDAFKVHEKYPNVRFDERGIEFLHIDISNDGGKLKQLIELWHPKLGGRALVLFEGGSEERDQVDWMVKYEKPSIKQELESNETINKFYYYATYNQFPSLTILLRRWWL